MATKAVIVDRQEPQMFPGRTWHIHMPRLVPGTHYGDSHATSFTVRISNAVSTPQDMISSATRNSMACNGRSIHITTAP
jgi:hypothetical protein